MVKTGTNHSRTVHGPTMITMFCIYWSKNRTHNPNVNRPVDPALKFKTRDDIRPINTGSNDRQPQLYIYSVSFKCKSMS